MTLDRAHRTASLDGARTRTRVSPRRRTNSSPPAIARGRCEAFRELDDALLRLRLNEPEIGTVIVRTEGDHRARARASIARSPRISRHWLVREIILMIKRTLKRLDLTARSLIAVIEPGSCFAGSLFELALAADRSYMLDDPRASERDRALADERRAAADGQRPVAAAGAVSRRSRSWSTSCSRKRSRSIAMAALDAGLVTVAPDELDWDDEVRLAIEARAALSPDALTGMEANLRFRRAGNDGNENLRPAVRVAELDLPAPQRGRRARRAQGLRRRARTARVRLEGRSDLEPLEPVRTLAAQG